jgi:protein involved in polysaccharide export with SLBB domain
MRAAGLPIAGFRARVQEAYKLKLKDAEVSVLLLEAAAKSVYVAGEVKTAGAIAYTPGLTLLQALATAGGMELTAQPEAVIVSRKDGKGRIGAYRIDVEAIIYQPQAPDFLLLPGDVVFVSTSGIADVGNWVELYIRRLIPLPLTTLGV